MGELDSLRAPPVRWLGYCRAVGNALTPGAVSMTRWKMTRITKYYIVFDILCKGLDRRQPCFGLKAVDAWIWQGIASVYLPRHILSVVSRESLYQMRKLDVAGPLNRFIHLGLVVITMPLLGTFVDRIVDVVLDHTTRPILFRWSKTTGNTKFIIVITNRRV